MSLVAELRHAARGLLRAPAQSAAAILCLGLGLGATTAIYSAVQTALLEPLPFPDADRLVTVFRTTPNFTSGPFSVPNWLDLRSNTRTLETLAAVTPGTALLRTENESARVSAYRASDNTFEALGVRALRGRLFQAGDASPDRPEVAILGEALWQTRFGADPDIIGRTIRLDGTEHEVIGILPAGFAIPQGSRLLESDVWVPLRYSPAQASARRSNFLMLFGRLRPGTRVEAADGELRALMDGIIRANPELLGEQLRVVPLRAEAQRSVRGPLLLLLGAVAFVLWIAAANVASLLLARGVGRQRETAMRAVLGASRTNMMRPALLESMLLTGAGLALGLALAWAGVRAIGTLAAVRMPQLRGLGLDGPVLITAIALAAIVALVCGLAPAWNASRSDPQEMLRAGGRGGIGKRQHRVLRTIVAVEVSLSLVLLLGAGLVLRGFSRLVSQEPGFDPEPLLTLNVAVPPENYANSPVYSTFLLRAFEAIRAVPGVVDVGTISLLPYAEWGTNFNIRYEGQPGDNPAQMPLVEIRSITPGLLDVLDLRLLAGRRYEEAEDPAPGSPITVLANQALVDRDFPGQDPIGKRFHIADTVFATIIGVVSNYKNMGPVRPPAPEVYYSIAQTSPGRTSYPLIVRVEGEPAAYAQAVTRAIQSVDATAAVSSVAPMTTVMASSIAQQRFYLLMLGLFAAAALVLAVAGLYGVMSYAVAQRTREIGIRGALGSTPRQTLAYVMKQGMRLVVGGLLVGIVTGTALNFALSGLLGSLLFGVSRWDGPTWTAAVLGLAGAGALAILLPARRAAIVEPIIAIREE